MSTEKGTGYTLHEKFRSSIPYSVPKDKDTLLIENYYFFHYILTTELIFFLFLYFSTIF